MSLFLLQGPLTNTSGVPVKLFLLPPPCLPSEGKKGEEREVEDEGRGKDRKMNKERDFPEKDVVKLSEEKKRRWDASLSRDMGAIHEVEEEEGNAHKIRKVGEEKEEENVAIFDREKEKARHVKTSSVGEDRRSSHLPRIKKLSLPSPKYYLDPLDKPKTEEENEKKVETSGANPSQQKEEDACSDVEKSLGGSDCGGERERSLGKEKEEEDDEKKELNGKIEEEEEEREEREEEEKDKTKRKEKEKKRKKAAKDFPLFDRSLGFEVYVHPGDMLYIPKLWWHFVKAESASVSVSHWFS